MKPKRKRSTKNKNTTEKISKNKGIPSAGPEQRPEQSAKAFNSCYNVENNIQ